MNPRPVKNVKNLLFVIMLTLWFGSFCAKGFSEMQTEKIESPAERKRDILFIIDNSGSMKKNDPDLMTKEIVTDFVNKHRSNSFFGMVVFGKEAVLVEPLSDVTTLEASSRFFRGLDRINYRGLYTNTPAAVERAIYELKANSRPDADKVIILLTDGIVDTGDKSSDLEKEKWLKEDLTRESKKAEIRIFGIAFTDKADFLLIQTLASRTGGEYFRSYTVEDIPGVLDKINAILSKPVEPSVPPASVVSRVDLTEGRPVPKAANLPDKKEPEKEKTSLLPLVLSILLVILGAVVLLLTMKRRSNDRNDEKVDTPGKNIVVAPDPSQLKGELIDVENIMKMGSVSLPLNKVSIRIGRDSGNEIVIPVDAISSFHATIEYQNGYYYLEDHRSTNGTFLNDSRIQKNAPVRLKSGDKINFAVHEFRFLLTGQAPFGETVILQEG